MCHVIKNAGFPTCANLWNARFCKPCTTNKSQYRGSLLEVDLLLEVLALESYRGPLFRLQYMRELTKRRGPSSTPRLLRLATILVLMVLMVDFRFAPCRTRMGAQVGSAALKASACRSVSATEVDPRTQKYCRPIDGIKAASPPLYTAVAWPTYSTDT